MCSAAKNQMLIDSTTAEAKSSPYYGGSKLWTKYDLVDIEEQLSRAREHEYFFVQSIHGRRGRIVNRKLGRQMQIWEPYVKFHANWHLADSQTGTPLQQGCLSYTVAWTNMVVREAPGLLSRARSTFEENQRIWASCCSCSLLASQLERSHVLGKVTKVVCFGLGDICRQIPQSIKQADGLGPEECEEDYRFVHSSTVQHSMALTIAQVCRRASGNRVQLLAQDPSYSDEAKDILRDHGFTIVGQHGAGGFADIDDNSIVFSAFLAAPIKQIIADIARPLMIIGNGFNADFDYMIPRGDPDSPRTRDMWQEYDCFSIPTSPTEADFLTENNMEFYMNVKRSDRIQS